MEKVSVQNTHVKYPYLIVNIGSGTSIIRVDEPGYYVEHGGFRSRRESISYDNLASRVPVVDSSDADAIDDIADPDSTTHGPLDAQSDIEESDTDEPSQSTSDSKTHQSNAAETSRNFARIGGSSIGGGTFFGLTRLLTKCKSFSEALALAETGHSTSVDMLVGDIYGGSYQSLGLSATTVASSFGKMIRPGNEEKVNAEDYAKSVLIMITNNIGQLAHLHAKLCGASQIFFTGNFLSHNAIARRTLAYAMNYWSKGNVRALFLEAEGYFGAVGALMHAHYRAENRAEKRNEKSGTT
jgi:pantothenate kinase